MAEIANNSIDIQVVETGGENAQYFWHNTTDSGAGEGAGAHVTQIPKADFIADPENGGGNTLITSEGMSIRDGVTSKASFGFMARIGEEEKARVEITDETFRQITDSGVAALDIQSSGSTITETITKNVLSWAAVFAGVNLDQWQTHTDEIVIQTFSDASTASPVVFSASTVKWNCPSPPPTSFITKTITYDADNDTTVAVATNVQLYPDVYASASLVWYTDGTLSLVISIRVDDADPYYAGKNGTGCFVKAYSYQETAEIPSIALNGEITFKKPTQVFVVENYNKSGVSVNNYTQTTIDCTKAGYNPLAIVGWHSSSSYTGVAQCCLINKAVGSCTIDIYLNNTSSSARTTNISYDVLWVKAE